MTTVEPVREFFPGVSDDQADDFVWSCTSFPFGSPDGRSAAAAYRDQVRALWCRSGGDLEEAFRIANDDVDQAMNCPVYTSRQAGDNAACEFEARMFDLDLPGWIRSPFGDLRARGQFDEEDQDDGI